MLLSGETGTGKDTIARRIHEMSGRKGRLVAMNCAAIPESLAESELFGVVSGAYTGADRSRVGYVEAAQGGTLYLDEIDSMPLSLQAKLLRVLETRALERLGSTSTIKLDICVIASAQCSLDDAVERGQFRRDLYFRLNVLTLKLPPLRTQSDRIVPLFTRFTAAAAGELGVAVPELARCCTKCCWATTGQAISVSSRLQPNAMCWVFPAGRRAAGRRALGLWAQIAIASDRKSLDSGVAQAPRQLCGFGKPGAGHAAPYALSTHQRIADLIFCKDAGTDSQAAAT